MREPVTAYIALGANLGDARAALLQAVRGLEKMPCTQVQRVSGIYKTSPMDTDAVTVAAAPGPDYLNAVVEINTGLNALALLDQLQRLEQQAGRERPYRNAPRTLDLDLLLYGSGHIESACLQIPHPRMQQRAFVLVPLSEIAPDQVSAEALEAVKHQAIEPLPA